MAHLWVWDSSGAWAIQTLAKEVYSLTENPPQSLEQIARKKREGIRVFIQRIQDTEGFSWVLITDSETFVKTNGASVPLGIRFLSDRDEIRVAMGHTYFFSTETLSTIEDFPGDGRPVFCPRCRQEVEQGLPAVKCPQCGVWYHQSDVLPCWTYHEKCVLCPQPTDLHAGYQWTPEKL